MKRHALILVMGLFFNPAIAQQKEVGPLEAQFDKLMSEQYKPHEPGATVLVARDGRIMYKKAFGMANLELDTPMQTNTVFKIGSLTKQFTAVAILQLMEQGKLRLQDEITRFITDYPTRGYTITIEHLLTHTSGIRNYSSIKDTTKRMTVDFTPTEMIDYFKNQPMRFPPGTKWEYSNSGYVLLGHIIEVITGKTYGEYLEENIFKPLAMTNSRYASDRTLITHRADGYTHGKQGFENAPYLSMTQPYAAGSILSTVEDLFTWHTAVHSGKLISKESLGKALTRYTLTDGKKTNYGYGWRFGYIRDSPSLWHGGWIFGFFTMAIYLPGEDLFVAVFSNDDSHSPEDLTARLAALAIGEPYEETTILVDHALLPQYTGVYENKDGLQQTITLSNNLLYAQQGRGPQTNLKAYQKDKFFFDDDVMRTIEFTRNNEGQVGKLIAKSRNGHEVWNKTDKPIPAPDGIKLDEKILKPYVGEYEITPEFTFLVTREQDRLFIQATGQERLEAFAESETKFFLKVNDAQLEFMRDDAGNVMKVVLNQGGRKADAKKIR